MRCLIVAAGQGIRMRAKGELKPLISIGGMFLIEQVIRRAISAGIVEFLVVVGYRSEDLQAELVAISERQGVPIASIVNQDWSRANGVSLLSAKPYLSEPFLLTMCDHLIDPGIYRDLMSIAPEPGSVVLAVDFNTANPLNDPDDVTRVRCSGGRIQQIGKSIEEFNAIDTGAFLCTRAIFAALEESQSQGDDSISGAMAVLANRGRAHVHDVGDRPWVDVDDPAAFEKAEHLLATGRL